VWNAASRQGSPWPPPWSAAERPYFSPHVGGKPRIRAVGGPIMVRAVGSTIETTRTDGHAIYLTDDVFLYRVVARVGRGSDEAVELEDCYGLDVVTVSIAELRARRLRVVTPASRQRR
jgi:hypothetical protein